MDGMKNTQSKVCLFTDRLLAYMVKDVHQVVFERIFEIYLFIFYWMRTQDGFYEIFCRMFSFYKKQKPFETKSVHQSSFYQSFPWKIFFIFQEFIFYSALSLNLKEPLWDLYGTFMGPLWDLLGTFMGPF